MSRRVAITAIGVTCALGPNLASSIATLRRNESAIGQKDVEGRFTIPAGVVEDSWILESGRQLDRTTRLALTAAAEALGEPSGEIDPRLGCVLGAGLGGVETSESAYEQVYGEQATRLRPTAIPAAMYNAATSAVATRYGAGGAAYAVSSACASSTHAIGQAASLIASGVIDRAITGGADAPLFPGIVAGWSSMRVLSPAGDDPSKACRPFSADRAGLVLAEGAAILMLELLDDAVARGVSILGEVIGFGMSSDAGHLTDPSSEGAARAVRAALMPMDGSEIVYPDYVNAHGTGTRANDLAESIALREVFGDEIDRIPVSSTKAAHGHAMGASGAIELVVSLAAANQGWIPGTVTLETPDPVLAIGNLPSSALDLRVRRIMSNSFGFGGMNASIVVRVV